jgi:hypothetical protein
MQYCIAPIGKLMPKSAMADLGDLETLALRRMPALEIL